MSFHVYFLTFENSNWERMVQRPVFTWSIHQVCDLILHFIQGQIQIILAFGEDGLDLSELAEIPTPKKMTPPEKAKPSWETKRPPAVFYSKKASQKTYIYIYKVQNNVYIYNLPLNKQLGFSQHPPLIKKKTHICHHRVSSFHCHGTLLRGATRSAAAAMVARPAGAASPVARLGVGVGMP